MAFAEVWELEQRFWLDGRAFYEKTLADTALMVFPAPVGILQKADILGGLTDAARWDAVEMAQKSQVSAEDTVVLAYRAMGKRHGDPPYVAFCSSTYLRRANGWLLLSHQQTPVAKPNPS